MLRRKSLTFVFSLMLLIALLTACTPLAPTTQPTESVAIADPPTATPLPEEKAPEDPPAAEAIDTPITIVDALGRTVTFEEYPQRIAITGRAHFMITDAAYCFPEAKARVIALSKSQQTETQSFTALLDPDYEAKAIFDSDSGAEEIAAARPDALLLKSLLAEGLGAEVEALGIPVVYIDLETPEQYQRDLGILGQLFGNSEHAEVLWSTYQSQLDQIAAAASTVSDAEKPQVLLLQYSESGGETALKAPPASWIQTQIVELAGGVPIWKEAVQGGGWAVVNFEQIAAWDPDQIFIINYFGNVDEAVATLVADPTWQGLTAVQSGEIYGFPKDFYSWDQPDSRWFLGLTWLATKIQPDSFPVDMEAEFYRFYETFYGLDATAVDDNVTPLLEGKSW